MKIVVITTMRKDKQQFYNKNKHFLKTKLNVYFFVKKVFISKIKTKPKLNKLFSTSL